MDVFNCHCEIGFFDSRDEELVGCLTPRISDRNEQSWRVRLKSLAFEPLLGLAL